MKRSTRKPKVQKSKAQKSKAQKSKAQKSKAQKPKVRRKAKTAASAGPGRAGIEERSAAGPVERDTTAMDDQSTLAPDDRVVTSNLTLHQLFEQQTARMLERADLNEEQKQSLLIGMSCPCCGAGGFSFTARLRRGG